jgi:hypothetical protein
MPHQQLDVLRWNVTVGCVSAPRGSCSLERDVWKPGQLKEVSPGLIETSDGLARKIARKGMKAAIRARHLANGLDGSRGKVDQPSERTLDGSSVSLGPRHPDGGKAGVQVAEMELRTIRTQAKLWRDDGRSNLPGSSPRH